MTPQNKPIQTLRDGLLKATIWKNHSENGSRYTVTFSRAYKAADGQYHDSDSYSGAELLRLSYLANHAYHAINEFKAKDSAPAYAA